MDIAKVYAHAREKEKDNVTELWGIRKLSLLEIERRKDKGLRDLAQEIYEDKTERGSIRGEAARIIAEAEGAKVAAKYLEDGQGGPDTTPETFRMALAEQLSRLRDEATDKKLVKLVGKDKPYKQRFVLRALKGYKDPALAKALAKEVLDNTKKAPPAKNDPEYNELRDLTLATMETLATLDDDATLADLNKVVETSKDEVLVAGALDAITVMRKGENEWLRKVEALASNPRQEVRNAALMQLGKTGDKKFIAPLVAAVSHAEWSTRVAALNGLVTMRAPEGIGAIIAQMDKETGLMLVRFADALWKLTGKPFRTSVPAWRSWWEKEGPGFTPVSLSELAKLEAEEELRRLKQTTKAATFFGIRILSHRVIFILDVSGSMNEVLRSEYVDKQGKPRIEVAKGELAKCIDALEPASLFNIITFSSDVDHWLDGGVAEFSQSNKDEAKKFVAALGAGGATNLYDALKIAFTDKDVDTIFVLSDGEPTAGEVTDQFVIRERVQQWNEHRGIVIHTIAVGGTFQILEWLAQDTGGSHRKFQ
jgi:HEAT repeat protein